MKIRFVPVALIAGLVLIASGAQSAEFDKVQKERSDFMKSISSENKTLRAAAKDGNMADVEKSASELASKFGKWADPSLFPKGSAEGTRAKPAIWENWADFEEKAATARKLAQAVAAQAKAGNVEETQMLVNSLAKQACNNCHDDYRGPRPKKGM